MKALLIILLIFLIFKAYSQESVPIQNEYIRAFDKYQLTNQKKIRTDVKPYFVLDTITPLDSIFSFGIVKPINKKNFIIRKWAYEPLVKIRESGLSLNVDPLFDMSVLKDRSVNENYFTNSRGIRINGDIDKELFFETSFIETQASFPQYVTDFIHISRVAPGQGQARRYDEGFLLVEPALEILSSSDITFNNGFDYSIASGSLAFRINKNFLASIGQGKFFVGEGYRSVLLSHNAFNYPYMRVDAHCDHFSYTRIMSLLMEDTLPNISFGVRDKRLGGFNILTYHPVHYFQFSLFEGTIWDFPNSRKNIEPDYNYYNPIILFNSLLARKNHFTLIGASAKLNFFKSFTAYGQYGFNFSKENAADFLASSSFQLGVKCFDIFGLPNLFIQAEHNRGGASVSSNENNYLPYSHYNQALAHPMGANFKESIFVLKYNYKAFGFESHYKIAEYGDDQVINPAVKKGFAKTFLYTTPIIGKGPKTEVHYLGFSFGYMFNAFSRRTFEIGYQYRKANWLNNEYLNDFIYVSFKTSISESFYDF